MKNRNGHTDFEKGMKEAFSNFSFSPDPLVWNRIETGLQRRRRIVLYSRVAVAASLLLLFSVTAWLILTTRVTESDSQPMVQVEKDARQKDEIKTPETISAEKLESASGPFLAEKDLPVQPEQISKKDIADKPTVARADEEINTVTDHQAEIAETSETSTAPVPVVVPGDAKPGLADQKLPTHDEIQHLLQPEEFLPEKSISAGWQLAMGYGTIQGHAVSDPSMAYDQTTANFGQDPFSSKILRETAQFSSIENTTHAQPITIGILLTRNFTESWGIETGLLYTRLKSTSYTDIVRNEFTHYTSEMHYIGIPASIRLYMIRGRRFGMYLSQGALIEKGIRVRYITNLYAYDILRSSEEGIYMAEGVQVSSLTAIGFDYKLGKRFSIYAQPGLQVFFLNHTQPYNIRSSSSIWPNLQTGLKFQF